MGRTKLTVTEKQFKKACEEVLDNYQTNKYLISYKKIFAEQHGIKRTSLQYLYKKYPEMNEIRKELNEIWQERLIIGTLNGDIKCPNFSKWLLQVGKIESTEDGLMTTVEKKQLDNQSKELDLREEEVNITIKSNVEED